MTDTLTATTAVSDKVATAALWGGVRIVVLDTETTNAPGGGSQRVISIGAVTCRAGTLRGKWQTLINPEVPIARESRRIHGITDEHLVGEPIFADVAGLLLPLLTPVDGERLVIAAHNVRFDISCLRHELQLIGQDIPVVPLIDTMGKLPGLVGVRPKSKSLTDLLEEVGVINSRHHDALADAVACAEALVELLNRAAAQSHTDFDVLLTEISAGATTHDIAAGARVGRGDKAATNPTLPADHVQGHSTPLSKRAGTKMLASWREQVTECASLRCRHLDARVLEAQPAPNVLRAELEAVLAAACTAGDIAGAATALGAMLPLLVHLPPRSGRLGLRNAVLFWARDWATKLSALGRCDHADQCPACRRREPCPLDMWPETIAAIALGDPARYAEGFFETTGREAGTGAYTSWLAKGFDPRIGDSAVWLCVEHWRSVGQDVRAQQLIQLSWDAGCRHPDVADAYAGQLAAAGRMADLQSGVEICEEAFSVRSDSTHEGWSRLSSRMNQLAGRVERLRVRPSGLLDEDGNPIPLRRHHPEAPRRTRQPRFVQL